MCSGRRRKYVDGKSHCSGCDTGGGSGQRRRPRRRFSAEYTRTVLKEAYTCEPWRDRGLAAAGAVVVKRGYHVSHCPNFRGPPLCPPPPGFSGLSSRPSTVRLGFKRQSMVFAQTAVSNLNRLSGCPATSAAIIGTSAATGIVDSTSSVRFRVAPSRRPL